MNAFFYPSKRGINFAKIRGFKVTDYNIRRRAIPISPRGERNGSLQRSEATAQIPISPLV